MRILTTALLTTAIGLAALGGASPAAAEPTPPTQPPNGPGGVAGKWGAVSPVLHEGAEDALDYWTFEPREWQGKAKKKPKRVPVILFLHGYAATDPGRYDAWIDHLVRKGSILVYPRYQAHPLVPTATYTPNAMAALGASVEWMRQNAIPKPDLRSGVNLIGHSFGGAVAANVAGRAIEAGLPKPASVLLANPFVENAGYKPPADAIDADLSGIPKETELDCVVADNDSFAGRLGCDRVFARTEHLKPEKRNYLWMWSDAYGDPDLNVSHFTPSVASPVDALDWYGYWKLADSLGTCALEKRNCNYALGGGAKQRNMGTWSDGTPVRRLGVFSSPPPCPPAANTYGC